jgi:hypothetical protein
MVRLSSLHCHFILTLLVDDDRVQDTLYKLRQIQEVAHSVDLSTDLDISSGLEAGGTLNRLVLNW